MDQQPNGLIIVCRLDKFIGNLKECSLIKKYRPRDGLTWFNPWFLYYMVAHFTMRSHGVNKVFFRKKIGFDNAFDDIKCLQQV